MYVYSVYEADMGGQPGAMQVLDVYRLVKPMTNGFVTKGHKLFAISDLNKNC